MPGTTRELDLRRLPPEMRHGLVFQCFDALKTGEALLIVNDHDPHPLLQQFRFARPGESGYEYLERGPTDWKVRIDRKASAQPSARQDEAPAPERRQAAVEELESVTEYLQADHRRLDAMLPDVERLVAAGDYQDAATRFAEFTSGLDRHIEAEEQVLFPTFESVTGMAGGPTTVMRSEHVEIRHWMRTATDSIARRDAALVAEAIGGLAQTLSVHNVKEEGMLYPMTDRAIGVEGRRALVGRLQAF
jgi:uncharacterized protein (DUF2249 family)/hemerythrin-like domain-containing protein